MSYCVYITIYKGNKLPMFYIGSSSTEKVNNGYHGSILSIEYKNIYKTELKTHPELFKTNIIKTFKTRKEATSYEEKIQRHLKVIKNPLYINKSYACKEGIFGHIAKGNDHMFYGKKGSDVPWYGYKRSETSKKNYSVSKLSENNPSACEYSIFDNNHNLVLSFKSNFIRNTIGLFGNKTTINAFITSYKTQTPLSFIKNKNNQYPLWDKKFEGWYATRKAPNHRKKAENKIKGRKHYYDPITNEISVTHDQKNNFLPGRPPHIGNKISQAKKISKELSSV